MTIRTFFTEHLGLTDPSVIELLCTHSRIRDVAKKEVILYQGECPDEMAFLLSGAVYTYTLDVDGNKEIFCIDNRLGEILLPPAPVGAPSSLYIEMLTPGTVLSFPLSLFFDLISQCPEVDALYQSYLFHAMENLQTTRIALTQKSAYEKLVWFISEFPGLYDPENHKFSIKKKHIAGFLRIHPSVLSNLLEQYRHDQELRTRPHPLPHYSSLSDLSSN